MKYAALIILALLTITCAVLEGLFDSLPAQFIQFNGLLTLVSTGVFLATWVTMVGTDSVHAE
jgi:hypothetical protein